MGGTGRLAAVWLGFCLCVAAAIAPAEFAARRASLEKQLDATLVLFGKTEAGEELDGFHQEPNFYYLTGWSEPGAAVLFTHTGATLFLPAHNEARERYTGRHASAEDAGVRERTGFDNVLPLGRFESELAKALETSEKLYALPDDTHTAALKSLAPLRTVQDAAPLITDLRVKKSPSEIEAIQHSTDVSLAAHRVAWKTIAPGLYEYQLAAVMSETVIDKGCERWAYAPIIGSGPNGAVLHYAENRRRMESGELVVMDVAGECAGYASDITRTLPANGHYTPRQREIYNVVLGAQQAAAAAVVAGKSMLTGHGPDSLYQVAYDYINTHGKDLHGEPLGKYFIHGLGHRVGLEVHDVGAGPLDKGDVFTLEPGIYIPEEKIGVRIEDILMLDENGKLVNLTADLPHTAEDVEAAMRP